MEILSI
jgi:hypothetical protein